VLAATGGVALLTWFYCATPPGKWLAGHDGADRTNATWTMHGEAAAPGAKRHRRFWHRPQWQRFLIRHAELLTPVLLGLAWWKARPVLITGGLATLALALIVAAVITAAALRRLPQHLAYVRPTHKALHRDFGQPARAKPGSWITRDRAGTKAKLLIRPGGNLTKPADEQRVGVAAAQLLGINDATPHWRHGGKTPHLLLLGHRPLPEAVTWPEVEQDARALPSGSVLLGPGWDDHMEVINPLDGDPHGFASFASRYGKTTSARTAGAQLAGQGWLVLICDAHFNSHPWAVGLPNVRVARTPADLTAAWIWAGQEATRRAKDSLARTSPDGSVAPSPWPHLFIIGEELGLQLPMLGAWHRQQTRRNTPGRAPALDGLTAVQHAGAGQGLHLYGIAQVARDDTLGGRGGRENHAFALFCNPSPQAERMFGLTPGAVAKTRIKGRVTIRRDDLRPCQIAEMTNVQARQIALSGAARWADYPGPPPFDYEDGATGAEPDDAPQWTATVVGVRSVQQQRAAAACSSSVQQPARVMTPEGGCDLGFAAGGPVVPGAARELGAAHRWAVESRAAVVPVPLRAAAEGLGVPLGKLRGMRDRGQLDDCLAPGLGDKRAKLYDLAALADRVSRVRS
jgi:hypothetical protein